MFRQTKWKLAKQDTELISLASDSDAKSSEDKDVSSEWQLHRTHDRPMLQTVTLLYLWSTGLKGSKRLQQKEAPHIAKD